MLVQLGDTYAQTEMYGDTYGYRSGLNKTMTEHLKRVADGLIKFLQLSSTDLVVDIGANDGTFLNNFASIGIPAAGIDPTSLKYTEYFDSKIKIVGDFFSSEVAAANKISDAKLKNHILKESFEIRSKLELTRSVNITLHLFSKKIFSCIFNESGSKKYFFCKEFFGLLIISILNS